MVVLFAVSWKQGKRVRMGVVTLGKFRIATLELGEVKEHRRRNAAQDRSSCHVSCSVHGPLKQRIYTLSLSFFLCAFPLSLLSLPFSLFWTRTALASARGRSLRLFESPRSNSTRAWSSVTRPWRSGSRSASGRRRNSRAKVASPIRLCFALTALVATERRKALERHDEAVRLRKEERQRRKCVLILCSCRWSIAYAPLVCSAQSVQN